jgi:hypothetical protein
MSARPRPARLIRRLLPFAVLITGAALATAPLRAQTCTPQNTCTDPRGCPDFRVDPGVLLYVVTLPSNLGVETRTYDPADCAVIEGEVPAGTNDFLIFSTGITNFGPGALTLGNPVDHPEWFDLVTCHGHPHIKEYADYRLWTATGYDQWIALRAANPGACAQDLLDANPAIAAQMIKGGKRGFCLYDVVPHNNLTSVSRTCTSPLDPATYPDCSDAGLGVCWMDIYEPEFGFTDGQSLPITDLPAGDYVLENEVNARRFFTETDYTNNSAAVSLRLRNGRIAKHPKPAILTP